MPGRDFFNNAWFCVYYFLLRPVIKWTIRQWTGQCELLRITYQEKDGYLRTKAIEKCLELSKVPAIRCLAFDLHVDIPRAVQQVQEIKDIKPEVHASFSDQFRTCIEQIMGYKEHLEEIEKLRKTPYSDDNDEHEYALMQLWNKLEPDLPLSSRISKDWQRIGFQGDDPKTDFRGMGMLGLENLIYFATTHTEEARQVYSHSHHPKYGYSFAVVGINLTALVHRLLSSNHLKTHYYNSIHGKPAVKHFHAVYCHIFREFDKFYREEEPEDIMQFNIIRRKFEEIMMRKCRNADFRMDSVFTEVV